MVPFRQSCGCLTSTNTHVSGNLPLVCLQGAGQEKLGIYIKSVVKGGAADMVSVTCRSRSDSGSLRTNEEPRPHSVSVQDGRLAAGDQLLSVDGRSLVGLSQER